jgi:hypothetical protein
MYKKSLKQAAEAGLSVIARKLGRMAEPFCMGKDA